MLHKLLDNGTTPLKTYYLSILLTHQMVTQLLFVRLKEHIWRLQMLWTAEWNICLITQLSASEPTPSTSGHSGHSSTAARRTIRRESGNRDNGKDYMDK